MSMATRATTCKDVDSEHLRQIQDRLSTALQILDAFAHRNKNQHRCTQWWAQFDMLRRGLRRALPDLEAAAQRASFRAAETSKTQKTKRRRTENGGGVVKTPELDRVEERANWLHEFVAAKAFESFSQLAADNQFAQLGLVLLGVLAQVEAAIAPFLKAEPLPEPEPAPPAVLPSAAQTTRPLVKNDAGHLPAPFGIASVDIDLGVAVSRDELDDDDVDAAPPDSRPMKKRKDPGLNSGSGNSTTLKKRNADGDVSPEPRIPSSKGVKKIKKKKKRKGGDEFDDLFSSLV